VEHGLDGRWIGCVWGSPQTEHFVGKGAGKILRNVGSHLGEIVAEPKTGSEIET
jgi:hypothetical protein